MRVKASSRKNADGARKFLSYIAFSATLKASSFVVKMSASL